MNKLNKKIISFVLLFSICLLVNVSYAEFTSTELNVLAPNLTAQSIGTSYMNNNNVPDTDYSYSKALEIINNYISDNNTYLDTFEAFVSAVQSTGKEVILGKYNNSYNMLLIINNADVGYNENFNNTGTSRLCFSNNSSIDSYVIVAYKNGSTYYLGSASYTPDKVAYNPMPSPVIYSSTDIKELTGETIWNGNYYYEVSSPDEPEIPSLPSNSEIASAVQAFYNSDYYKNNKDFKDFIVMYNYNNQYFSFIGHNNEDKIQQLIFPDGYKYNQQWWKFGLDGLIETTSSYLFNKRYWLYSSNDFGENIVYNGEGYMKDLLELNFSISSIIVYSSNDYDVIYYTYNENNELTSVMETMPGDQYTYDENLDPTTNEYNPLESFVPTNPSQTILGDVDFDEINKTFEENKDILNIEGASWLFTANNKLVGYFIGFLSLLIVFLIISRILGG